MPQGNFIGNTSKACRRPEEEGGKAGFPEVHNRRPMDGRTATTLNLAGADEKRLVEKRVWGGVPEKCFDKGERGNGAPTLNGCNSVTLRANG